MSKFSRRTKSLLLREHRPPSKHSKTPDVWKILGLLYQQSEECNQLKLARSKVPITKVMKPAQAQPLDSQQGHLGPEKEVD